MCVATMALAATAASAAGSLVGGIAQGQAYHYQAQVAQNNAQIARDNAEQAASAGAQQAEQAGLKARAQLSGIRAAEAANNVDVNSGSAADVQESQRLLGQEDVATVSHNAALQVYGYENQAVSDTAQARLDKQAAFWAPIEGVLGAGGKIAGNAGMDGFGQSSGVSPSLISGNPSVPDTYRWMQSGDQTDAGTELG